VRDVGRRKKVPDDLMGSILGQSPQTPSKEQTSSEQPKLERRGRVKSEKSAGEGREISWEPSPERAGTTFNLSRQVSTELDRLRLELQLDEDIRSSKSEIAEIALQMAIEDARARGAESELLKRLSGNYRRL
jgi:hypothetical protein